MAGMTALLADRQSLVQSADDSSALSVHSNNSNYNSNDPMINGQDDIHIHPAHSLNHP